MITEDREKFYSSSRNEPFTYEQAETAMMVPVPLTREGFEALCKRAVKDQDLILDDGIRSLIAGYIHHVPSNETTFDLSDLCRVVYKTLSNNLTFAIDQEAKQRAQAAIKASQENVIQINKDAPPTDSE